MRGANYKGENHRIEGNFLQMVLKFNLSELLEENHVNKRQ